MTFPARIVPSPPYRDEPTTYSCLTRSAATRLAMALLAADRSQPTGTAAAGGTTLHEAVRAHRHLSAMLGHLGQTLGAPLPDPGAGQAPDPPRPPRTVDAVLAARLRAIGALRDWQETEPPAESIAGSLLAAARLVGAAADLWASHHDPTGRPRSRDASRLRHPATLGAAAREWRELVVVAGAVADALATWPQEEAPGTTADRVFPATTCPRRYAADYPAPVLRRNDPRGAVTVTTARSAAVRSRQPLVAIEQRVRSLQQAAWTLASTGTAPIPVLANLVAIGVMLSGAAGAAGERAAAATASAARAELQGSSVEARRTADAWRQAATALAPLRSAHPATTSVQVDRLDLARLLDRVASSRGARHDVVVTRALLELSRQYGELAEDLATALAAAQERGEVLLVGRAIPTESLARRPDLLEAKLRDSVVRAPTSAVRRAEAALRAVPTTGGTTLAPDGPPAA